MDLDTAHKEAVSLFDYIDKNARTIENEADTRFQIIDRVLLEVLGWPRSDFKLEPYSPAGYADYLLRINGTNRFVIEAKRTGQLLVDTANPRYARYKVGGPALGSAMAGLQQGVQYCVENGADYAALTNGVSWISFLPFPSAGQSYKYSEHRRIRRVARRDILEPRLRGQKSELVGEQRYPAQSKAHPTGHYVAVL